MMSDVFDDLPDKPFESSQEDLREVKSLISSKLYLELTGGSEAVAQVAQRHAKIKASSMLRLVDVKLDETLELHKQIVGWLCVYFLYVFNGQSSAENEYLEMAKDLIANHYHQDELKSLVAPAGSVAQSTWQNRYKK